MASNLASRTVASRIQAIQDGQGSRNSKLAGQVPKPEQGSKVDITNGRVRRANTALASSASLENNGRNGSSRHGGRATGDDAPYQRFAEHAADKKSLTVGLPARPATSLESMSSPQRPKPSSFSKPSPDRRNVHARQSSLGAWSATEHRLSEARARLKSIDIGTNGNQAVTRRGTTVSPSRRKTDISELQNLIDDALDEQTKLDITTPSTKQPPHKSIASHAQMRMASPTKRQSIELSSNRSPARHDQAIQSSNRAGVPVPISTDLRGPGSNYPSFPPAQQISPTRKERPSTESFLPRSSTASEPSVTLAYPSVCSSPEFKPRHESVLLHVQSPTGQVQSPVKERTAAFEKMMQRDKQIMYGQLDKQNGNVAIKKNWWLDSSDSDAAHPPERKVTQDFNPMTTTTGRTFQLHPPANVDTAKSAPKPGPIPLALPRLVSRGRAVSASSQFEDSFDTAPESEAALSRLSSRMQSPRTVPKPLGTQETVNEMKSPLFRWKPFMLDKSLPVHKTNPGPPRETSLEANAGSGATETVKDNIPHQLQLRARDIARSGTPSKDAALASTSGEDHLQALISKRQALRSTTSTARDHMAMDGVGNMIKQVDDREIHQYTDSTASGPNSDNLAIDDGKEAAILQSDKITEESETEGAAGIEATNSSPCRSTKDSTTTTPFPLIPVPLDTSNNNPASASVPVSPTRGRAFSRTLQRQRNLITEDGDGSRVRVSRSRSNVGNVRVTVEVRTPQGSPKKGNGDGDAGEVGVGGDKVVIVTTDVQGDQDGQE